LSLFFIGDGVYQLFNKHHANLILQKDFQPMFQMLDLYDVEQIYVCETSLLQRNISIDQLVVNATVVSVETINQLLAQQDQLLSF